MNFRNVHRMFVTYIYIYIEHRNPEIRKNTYDFLVQARNFLLPLSLKVFQHKERKAQSFYAGFFICPPPPPTRVAPTTRPLRASESHPSSSDRKTQLTDFLQNPLNPPRALPVHDVIQIPKSQFSIRDFYFYICERHILPARALTPAPKFAPN